MNTPSAFGATTRLFVLAVAALAVLAAAWIGLVTPAVPVVEYSVCALMCWLLGFVAMATFEPAQSVVLSSEVLG